MTAADFLAAWQTGWDWAAANQFCLDTLVPLLLAAGAIRIITRAID